MAKALSVSYLDRILGAAVFDLTGLPKDYYISAESADISWVQSIFQALGLQALLTSSFQLKEFRHAVIHGAHCHAIVIRQANCYLALLIRQGETPVSEDWIQWAVSFDPALLADDPRFNST
ncbi:MAG: hypothetical protein IGS54_00955 [Elainella sp. C42_A2020_010]|nr:hypothetical protein [Elainella sp. C42_A2020_010]RNJ68304.1 MAG: hypothetical protein EDM05_14375 [Leptolyngbya sp. IPPAS B-1204]